MTCPAIVRLNLHQCVAIAVHRVRVSSLRPQKRLSELIATNEKLLAENAVLKAAAAAPSAPSTWRGSGGADVASSSSAMSQHSGNSWVDDDCVSSAGSVSLGAAKAVPTRVSGRKRSTGARVEPSSPQASLSAPSSSSSILAGLVRKLHVGGSGGAARTALLPDVAEVVDDTDDDEYGNEPP